MTELHDILEVCLKEIENGADIEALLLRFPDAAEELRPILTASLNARALSVPEPSQEVIKRSRSKILQRAAEMREADVRPRPVFNWFSPVLRAGATLAVLVLLFASGTSLVGASSTSLPGDELYPVKRSWERLQVFFLFDDNARDELEVEHENERIKELKDLFASGRTAEVAFSGIVTFQSETGWQVAGIPVILSPETGMPDREVAVGDAVRVEGSAQTDGSVLAMQIEILPPGAKLPEVEDDGPGEPGKGGEGESDSGNENEGTGEFVSPTVAAQTPEAEFGFNGVLDVFNGEFWTINGVPSDVSKAEVVGTPAVNAPVKVEGYFNPDGLFVVTKIEFKNDDSGSDSGSNSNNSGGNDNGNDNNNDGGDDNGNDSEDDNNNGSGGGDDD